MSESSSGIGHARWRSTLGLVHGLSPRYGVVLEIGAEDGSFREAIAHDRWITVDKYGDPDIRVDLEDCAGLPIDDRSIDLVILTEVLEHLRVGMPLVEEIARVLAPTGWAVVSVPNIASLKSRALLAIGRVPNMAASGDCGPPLGGTGLQVDGRWVAGHVADFNEQRLVAYLKRGGLAVKRHEKVPFPLWRKGNVERVIPPAVLPRRMYDYLLVAAQSE